MIPDLPCSPGPSRPHPEAAGPPLRPERPLEHLFTPHARWSGAFSNWKHSPQLGRCLLPPCLAPRGPGGEAPGLRVLLSSLASRRCPPLCLLTPCAASPLRHHRPNAPACSFSERTRLCPTRAQTRNSGSFPGGQPRKLALKEFSAVPSKGCAPSLLAAAVPPLSQTPHGACGQAGCKRFCVVLGPLSVLFPHRGI